MDVHALLSHPTIRAHIERALAARGRGGDDHIVHVNDQEMGALKAMGGSGTINPHTGLREFLQAGGNKGSTGDSGGLGAGAGGLGAGQGYGNASDGHSSIGSGAGYGGGGSGNNFQQFGTYNPVQYYNPPPAPAPAPLPPPPPPPPPVTTAPMMSSPSANLIGSRFGAVPSWATQSYQIGTAPTSYPTPGVNTADVAPQPTPQGGQGGLGGLGGQGGQGGGGQMGGGGQSQMPPVGTPQAIAAGLGTFPNGAVGQATSGAYSPNQLAILSAFGITPNPVAHQLQLNKNAAWHGATMQQMAHPYVLQQSQGSGMQQATQHLQQAPQNVQKPAQNQQKGKVTSNGATPAFAMEPTRAGGVLTGIMGSKPPTSQAKTKTGAGAPRNS